jgi:hypothetical protein
MTQSEEWMMVLRNAVAAKSVTEVAKRLRYSHPTVSLVLSGKYLGKTDRVAARVMQVFGQVTCPHTGVETTLTVCLDFATRRAPLNNPLELNHWRTCQSCPNRPIGKENEKGEFK